MRRTLLSSTRSVLVLGAALCAAPAGCAHSAPQARPITLASACRAQTDCGTGWCEAQVCTSREP